VGTWLNRNTEPEAVVGINEVGIIGYYSDRKMMDLWGLVFAEMGKAEIQYNTDYLVEIFKPDYFVSQIPAPYSKLRVGTPRTEVRTEDYDYNLVKEFNDPGLQVGIWKRQRRIDLSNNLLSSKGVVMSSSSHNTESETVDKLIDGSEETFWHVSSEEIGELNWVMVDSGDGRNKTIHSLAARPREGFPQQFFRKAELFGSKDGANWVSIIPIVQNEKPNDNEWKLWEFENDRSFRYYKLEIYDGHENGPAHHFYSMAELAMFE